LRYSLFKNRLPAIAFAIVYYGELPLRAGVDLEHFKRFACTVKVTGTKFKCFYKVSMLYCLNILLFLLFDNTSSKTGGFSRYWLGFQGVSAIGWNSKVSLLLAGIVSKLVDDGKSLFLWGDQLDFFCRLLC